MILADQLVKTVDELVPLNCVVMVHASLRSFGTPVADGVDTLLDALLTDGRTVLVPAFTEPQFGLIPIDYTKLPAAPPESQDPVYASDCGLINLRPSVLPAALINRARCVPTNERQ